MATNYNLKLNLISDDKQFSAGFRKASNALKEHQNKVKKTGVSYQSLNKTQRLTANYAREVGVALGRDSREFLKARKEANRYRAELDKIGGFKGAGGSAGLLGSVIGVATRRILPLMAIGAAGRALGDFVKVSSEFEAAMSEVLAITGATESEMEMLSDQALILGRTTQRTARDVLRLQVELSKLGFSASQINSATEGILQLSVATRSDLGEAASIVASTLRGFQLTASQTKRVVDVMAKSFASSALDIDKFKTAMTIAAPAANVAGLSMEFTTSMLGVLANAGLDASMSGTALRNIF